MSAEEPPAPVTVDALVGTDQSFVQWTPPLLSPEDALIAKYRVYGKTGNTEELLATIDGTWVAAKVEGGFETYAVALFLHDVESVRVYASTCVSVHQSSPYVTSC